MKSDDKLEDAEDLEKFRSWLLGYLDQCTYEDILVRRLRDHVSSLCEYEKHFSERLKGQHKTVVQFKPRHTLQLVSERTTK